ncbi:MAG: tetratricopeptide repeat protein [Rhodothermales bacterium]
MKKLTSNPTLVLLAAGFGLFAVLAFAQKSASPEPSSSPLRAVAEVAPPPSADNVDPSFHARLMALREQLTTTPDDTTALLQAARLEQDAHQLPAAAEHYERYLALRPQAHQVWLDLANVLAGDGRWDEAQRASESMLEHYPDDPSAMYNLGAIHANQGRPDEARRWWTSVQGGADASLAERATSSLGQLAGVATASTNPRPATSGASRANPHAALPMQPVVARRVSGLGAE